MSEKEKNFEGINILEENLERRVDQKLCAAVWNRLAQNRDDIQQTIKSQGLVFSCIREIFSKIKNKYAISVFAENSNLIYEFFLIKQKDQFTFNQIDNHPLVSKEMARLFLEGLAGKEGTENQVHEQIREIKEQVDLLQLE